MHHKWMVLLTALIMFSLLITPVGAAQAQDANPDCPVYEPGLLKEKEFLRSLPLECIQAYQEAARQLNSVASAQDVGPMTTGGPDGFGYTYDDSVPYNWISGTTNSGLTGDDEFSGPINIGFNFPFYGVAHSQLYFSTNGLISFGAGSSEWDGYDIGIGNDLSPNNMIAPLWDDLLVGSPYNSGGIYYSQGGTAPNRYFVVEWRNVENWSESSSIPFEAILYENGNIVFQYPSAPSRFAPVIGIEDSIGHEGLTYDDSNITPFKAVRFSYPAPAARMLVSPLSAGEFVFGGSKDFHLTVTNTGTLAADTYDLTTISSDWPITLYASDGVTPLTDTDADTFIDTGSLSPGSSTTVIARFTTPNGAEVGDDNTCTLILHSSLDYVNVTEAIYLSMSIPANFANTFRDEANDAVSFMAITSNGTNTYKATADNYLALGTSVAKLTNGNYFHVWHKPHATPSNYWRDIEYTVIGRNGNVIRPITKLTDNANATQSTDWIPSVGVAPNGTIGVAWYRRLENLSNQYNYNIYFATLDASGNVLTGPTNITNNTVWGTSSDFDFPLFLHPTIAASDDNRFIIAWEDEREGPMGGELYDVWYAVRNSAGASVLAPTKLTNNMASQYPILNSLTGGKVIITWTSFISGPYYAIISSNGAIVKSATYLPTSADEFHTPDAVQLPNGNVGVAWASDDLSTELMPGVELAILDSSYNRIAAPTFAYNHDLRSPVPNESLSVTTDASSHVIMTWNGRPNQLLYALGDSNGTFLSEPMIFRTSGNYINGSSNGQGNVPYDEGVFIRGNTGMAGVTLRYTDGTLQTVTSDASGNYSLNVPKGWSGIVKPFKAGYAFTPINRTYNNVQSNQTGQNYTASLKGADTTGVFRPSNGALYLKHKNETGYADVQINYGIGGDYPVVGDWDGNGTVTIGIYRNGSFYLRNSNTIGFADWVIPFGAPGDQPVAGDWNGDGIDTIGVYRNGTFFLRNSNSSGAPDMVFGLGIPGDVGIAGDWNGDGFDTTGVFRPSNGALYLKNQNSTGFADVQINYGIGGDKPVTGDWNGDGIDTIGVYRNGEFLLRNSNTIGYADWVFALGIPGDHPIAGNWDGLP